jgi:hypothetical protein
MPRSLIKLDEPLLPPISLLEVIGWNDVTNILYVKLLLFQ